MAESASRRKLAAILSADAAGYSRLMADDEAATVETLTKYREVFAELVARHDGRVVDSPGDNVLAEFASPVEAVACAVEVQHELARRNRQLAEHRRMDFRIGVNLGDVITKDDGTLYGDGVNVAARLEGLAEPGGVTVSAMVHEAVRGKLDVGFADAGAHEVKNIAEPVRAFRVVAEGAAPAPERGKRWRGPLVATVSTLVVVIAAVAVWQTREQAQVAEATDPILALPTGPSIAVLPFTNMSGDPEQEYFADGITEQIISELTRFRDLFVIARNSTFQYKGKAVDVRDVARDLGVRYVVEGSVRRAAGSVRVTAQLIDAGTGGHLWAETYERALTAENVFAIQDEVAQNMVATLASAAGVMSRTEVWRAKTSRTSSLEAYECVLLAHDYVAFTYTLEMQTTVLDCLERAVEIDPEYVDAWAWKAFVYLLGYADDFGDPGDYLARGLDNAQRAVSLDPTNQMARHTMATSYLFRHEVARAKEEADAAIALNPNNAFVIGDLGQLLMYTGEWDKYLPVLNKAMALNPSFPSYWWYPVAKRHLVKGELDAAAAAIEKVATPDVWIFPLASAYIYQFAGRTEDARRAINDLLRLRPDMTVQKAADLYVRYNFQPEYIERYVIEGLRKAGLPEGARTN